MNFLFSCSDESVQVILGLVRLIINIFKIVVPILLIVFGMIDLGKAVMAGKEDEMKKSQGTLIKRIIYAVLIFLVVTIVQLVMSIVSEAGADTGDINWYDCLYNSGTTSDDDNNIVG